MNRISTTFANFEIATGLNGNPKKRGAMMRDVDGVFKDYEKDFANADDFGQHTLTSKLYVQCKNWLRDKESKSIVKKNIVGPNTFNNNLEKRRDEISTVAKQCLEELHLATPIAKFEARKIDTLKQGREKKRAAMPLSGTYMRERETWDDLKKEGFVEPAGRAVSASLVHSYLESKHIGTEFEGLSKNDFLRYAEKFAKNNAGKKHVPYYRKKKRLDFMVDINGDGMLCSASNGTFIDCQIPAFNLRRFKADNWQVQWKKFTSQLNIYAMDRYGNLFQNHIFTAGELKKEYGTSFGAYNHSTLNAGRDVICAGLIGVNQGRLIWIDNESGHYKPGKDALKQALEVLQADGADLSQTVVPLRDFTSGKNHFYYAGEFLKVNGHAFGTD